MKHMKMKRYQLSLAALLGMTLLTGCEMKEEIWSKEKWAENSNYDDMDAIAEGMQEMGIVI